jgi:hypothetical protein
MKLVTPSALVERLKINGSLARAACKYMEQVHIHIYQLPHMLIKNNYRKEKFSLLRNTTNN